MAKPPSSAIGIDIGRHSMKAVLLSRRVGGRFALTHFAVRELEGEPEGDEAFQAHLKALLQELGGSAKACGVVASHPEAFVRIIEQPPMPPETLRNALHFNGPSLVNMECKDFVMDCDAILPLPAAGAAAQEAVPYVVGGVPRTEVLRIHEALQKSRIPSTRLQLSPVAIFNAFEFANPETFNSQPFVLVNIGHSSSTVIVGVKRELVLVRVLDFGGRAFVEELICHGASGYEEVARLLAEEEVLTVENARLSLTELVRSISSSIGFVEARREESIPRVFFSGGVIKAGVILKLLTEELQLPCEAWDPFAKCEISLSGARREAFESERPVLASACGVAAEILKGE